MLKKTLFYLVVSLFIFAGQFLLSSGLVTGTPPPITQTTLSGTEPMARLGKGPALIYFWAEWCGVCRSIQSNVDAVVQDYPTLSVAVRSTDEATLRAYLQTQRLNWPVVNDSDGAIGQRYGISGVPAVFFLDRAGDIVFTSVGYTSEWGLRARLWLAGLL